MELKWLIVDLLEESSDDYYVLGWRMNIKLRWLFVDLSFVGDLIYRLIYTLQNEISENINTYQKQENEGITIFVLYNDVTRTISIIPIKVFIR